VRTLSAKYDTLCDVMYKSFVLMKGRMDTSNATNDALCSEVRMLRTENDAMCKKMHTHNDAMAIQVSNLVIQLKNHQRPRSSEEALKFVESKQCGMGAESSACAAVESADGEADEAQEHAHNKKPCVEGTADTVTASGVMDDDEEQEQAHTCAKRSCIRPTTKTKGGRWLKQCAMCRARCGTKKKPVPIPNTNENDMQDGELNTTLLAMQASLDTVVQQQGQKHPRSNEEPLQCIQNKKPRMGDKASASTAVVASGGESDYATEVKAPTCCKVGCHRPTARMSNSRWRKQCHACIAQC
jgi:hypothetical protein